eukprot:scaffold78115_cov21-Tisochrysis_lutea.AAC.5
MPPGLFNAHCLFFLCLNPAAPFRCAWVISSHTEHHVSANGLCSALSICARWFVFRSLHNRGSSEDAQTTFFIRLEVQLSPMNLMVHLESIDTLHTRTLAGAPCILFSTSLLHNESSIGADLRSVMCLLARRPAALQPCGQGCAGRRGNSCSSVYT